jgi:hypothetical protein
LIPLAVIWYISCRAAKCIDGLKWSKAFMVVHCFIVNGPEGSQWHLCKNSSDRRVQCGVALWFCGEGWSHLVTDHLFGPLQEQTECRHFALLWGSGNSSAWMVAKVSAWLLERQSLWTHAKVGKMLSVCAGSMLKSNDTSLK